LGGAEEGKGKHRVAKPKKQEKEEVIVLLGCWGSIVFLNRYKSMELEETKHKRWKRRNEVKKTFKAENRNRLIQ